MGKLLTTATSFFTGLSWKVYAGIAALAFLSATVWYCNSQVKDKIEQAEESGKTAERNDQLERTIENVEKAEEARKAITTPGPVGDLTRYNQCLRTARTPDNCERLLPSGETPVGRD